MALARSCAAACAALVLALAGCGGDEGPSTTPAPTTGGAVDVARLPPAQRAQLRTHVTKLARFQDRSRAQFNDLPRPRGSDVRATAAVLETRARLHHRFAAELRTLRPPSLLAGQHRAYVAAVGREERAWRAAGDAGRRAGASTAELNGLYQRAIAADRAADRVLDALASRFQAGGTQPEQP